MGKGFGWAVLLTLAANAASAASTSSPLLHPTCTDVPSATYVPGVDAYGRAVAPADLPDQPPMDLSKITVVPRVAVPGNPTMRDAQVVVDLKGQLASPASSCSQATPAPQKH